MTSASLNQEKFPMLCSNCQDTAEVVTVLELFQNKARVRNAAGEQLEVLTDLISVVTVGDQIWVDAGVALGRIQ